MTEKKGPPNINGLFTLKVDNIDFRTTADALRDVFAKYGELGDVYIPRDYHSRQPRGFAFVRFANRSDGEEAQKTLDGTTLDGRVLAIHEAQKERADNPKQAMTERGGPLRDQRRWDNDRDHRPRGGHGHDDGYYDYGNRGRDYHDYDRRRGGDYGYDYDRGYGNRGGYRDNNNYSSSRDTGYGYDSHRGYDGGRGRNYDYGRRDGPPSSSASGYGDDRRYHERSPHRDRDRDIPLTRGDERYREDTGAAAYDRGRNEDVGNDGSPEEGRRPLRSRTRSRSRDRTL